MTRFQDITCQQLKLGDRSELRVMLSRGLALCDLVNKGDNIFGGMILTAYAYAIFLGSFGIYFSFSVFHVYDSELGRINELVLLLTLCNLTIATFSIYRKVLRGLYE